MKKKKQEKRLAFNFLLSYYEVFKRLPDAESKEKFITALCEKQFNGKDPKLDGIVEFAYASQKHSIDKSRKGWDDSLKKEKINHSEDSDNQSNKQSTLEGSTQPPLTHPWQGSYEGPSVQEKEEEKGKEEDKLKRIKEEEEKIKEKIKNKEKIIVKNKNEILLYVPQILDEYALDAVAVNEYVTDMLKGPQEINIDIVKELLKFSKF